MADTLTSISSLARIETPKALGYLIQLCKHFAHKTPASFSGNRGKIEFTAGVCELDATNETTLVVECVAADDPLLRTVEAAEFGMDGRHSDCDIRREWGVPELLAVERSGGDSAHYGPCFSLRHRLH